jgi:hypothetical protein
MSDIHPVVQLCLNQDRTMVVLTLPDMPLAEWDGVPVTGLSLTIEAARELAVQLIRWSILCEEASDPQPHAEEPTEL